MALLTPTSPWEGIPGTNVPWGSLSHPVGLNHPNSRFPAQPQQEAEKECTLVSRGREPSTQPSWDRTAAGRHLSQGAFLASKQSFRLNFPRSLLCLDINFPVNYQQVGTKGTQQNVIYNLEFITEKGSAVIVCLQSFSKMPSRRRRGVW